MPVDRVMALSSQGYSDPEIIRSLRDEGYNPTEVDKALKEALKSTISPMRPRFPQQENPQIDFQRPEPRPYPGREPEPEEYPDEPMAERPQLERPPQRRMPQQPQQPQQRPMGQRPGPGPGPSPEFDEQPRPVGDLGLPDMPGLRPSRPKMQAQDYQSGGYDEQGYPQGEQEPEIPRLGHQSKSGSRMEEIAEAVVEERFSIVDVDIQSLKNELAELKRLGAGKPGESKELSSMQGKFEDFDRRLTSMSTKLEALEKVMKDSLAPMMETMRTLADTVRDMKER